MIQYALQCTKTKAKAKAKANAGGTSRKHM